MPLNCFFLKSFQQQSVRRRLLNKSLARLKDKFRGRVLEIGGGRIRRSGRFAPNQESISHFVCLDICRERQPHCQGDVQKLPFGDRLFDTVLFLEVLEYVESPLLALQEIYRILKADGTLIMSVPFLHRWDSPKDYWRLTQPGLEHVLSEKSFKVDTIESNGGPLAVIANIAQFLLTQGNENLYKCLFSGLLHPLLTAIVLLDPFITAKSPSFRTFTTGYTIVARADRENETSKRQSGADERS